MAFTVYLEPALRLRTVVVSDEIHAEEARAFLERVYADSSFDPKMGSVWDLRDLEPEAPALSSQDVKDLVQSVGQKWAGISQGRVALVTTRGVDYGLARMFSVLMEPLAPGRVRAFQNLDQARSWVQEGADPPTQYSLPLKIQTSSPGLLDP